MDLLDLLIVVAAVVFAVSGYRRGVSWVGFSVAGLLLGLVLGAAVAPHVAHAVAPPRSTDTGNRGVLASAIFLSIVLVVQGVGTAIGYLAHTATLRSHGRRFTAIDQTLGSGLAIIAMLASTWFLGLTFAQSKSVVLNQQIRDSAIVRRLNAIAPSPPGLLLNVANVVRGVEFPNPFTSLVPQALPPVQIPASLDSAGVRAAQQVTSKVLSRGCNGIDAGSAWPLGNDDMVTNAHVVAGGQSIEVQPPSGRTYRATVVLFDPDLDIAVLRVPGIGLPALPIASDEPPRGTAAAVIGYPRGGDESVALAALKGDETAQGQNIYNDQSVRRRIGVLAGEVIPGNSGGPLVDGDGRVIGLVFAASTVDPNEGYALTMPQLSDDLSAGRGQTTAVSTQNCIGG